MQKRQVLTIIIEFHRTNEDTTQDDFYVDGYKRSSIIYKL